MNIDALQRAVAERRIEKWRKPGWPDSLAMSSTAAAHQYSTLSDLFETYIPPGARILDWGSGSAFFSFALADEGFTVNAMDFYVPPMREFIE